MKLPTPHNLLRDLLALAGPDSPLRKVAFKLCKGHELEIHYFPFDGKVLDERPPVGGEARVIETERGEALALRARPQERRFWGATFDDAMRKALAKCEGEVAAELKLCVPERTNIVFRAAYQAHVDPGDNPEEALLLVLFYDVIGVARRTSPVSPMASEPHPVDARFDDAKANTAS